MAAHVGDAEAQALDGLLDVAELRGAARRERQFQRFCGEVYAGIGHAIHASERRFNLADATGAIHTFDPKAQLFVLRSCAVQCFQRHINLLVL